MNASDLLFDAEYLRILRVFEGQEQERRSAISLHPAAASKHQVFAGRIADSEVTWLSFGSPDSRQQCACLDNEFFPAWLSETGRFPIKQIEHVGEVRSGCVERRQFDAKRLPTCTAAFDLAVGLHLKNRLHPMLAIGILENAQVVNQSWIFHLSVSQD
jgi:hypothetical protein